MTFIYSRVSVRPSSHCLLTKWSSANSPTNFACLWAKHKLPERSLGSLWATSKVYSSVSPFFFFCVSQIFCARSSCPLGERAFSSAGPCEWNRLPLAIRQAESVPAFKSNLKTSFNYVFWIQSSCTIYLLLFYFYIYIIALPVSYSITLFYYTI